MQQLLLEHVPPSWYVLRAGAAGPARRAHWMRYGASSVQLPYIADEYNSGRKINSAKLLSVKTSIVRADVSNLLVIPAPLEFLGNIGG
jgi:hypothetical protein